MSNFWYFFSYLMAYRKRLAVAMTCALLAATLVAASIGMTLAVFKIVFGEGKITLHEYVTNVNEGKYGKLIPDQFVGLIPTDYMTGVLILILTMVGLMIFSSILRVAHNYLSAVVCIRAGRDIRIKLFKTLVTLPMLTLVDQPVTERVGRVMRDTHQLMKGYMNLLGRSMGDLLTGIAALTMAIWAEPMVSLAALGLAPILALYYWRHGKLVRRAGRRVLQQWAKLLGAIVESLQGIRVVKVHHAERFEIHRFRKANQKYVKAEYPLRWRKSIASPTIQIIIMLGFAAVAYVAALRLDAGTARSEDVLTALMSLFFVAARFKPLTMVYSEVAEASAAGERLLEILNLEPEQDPADRCTELPRLTKSIRFNNVSFKYPSAEAPILKNINLEIPRGKTFAFVGPNGCGKTTLLSLVPRLFDPSEGTLTIDGHKLTKVSLASLRQQVAVVTQETVLFQDSIAANIAYGLDLAKEIGPDIDNETRKRIKAAARHAHAHKFITKKPEGYLTDVGERGLTLSGGERQRVAIARAILRDPAILILDEATSMIDAETESQITEALSEFCRDRTSLVIAHRLSTVVDADQIVVMNQGGIEDQGTHTELMQRCLLYQQLCRTQLVSEKGSTKNNLGANPRETDAAADLPSTGENPQKIQNPAFDDPKDGLDEIGNPANKL